MPGGLEASVHEGVRLAPLQDDSLQVDVVFQGQIYLLANANWSV